MDLQVTPRSRSTEKSARSLLACSMRGICYERTWNPKRPAKTPEPSRTSCAMPFFVPETKSVAGLFYTFRKRKLSLALTIGEYGGGPAWSPWRMCWSASSARP